MDFQSAVEYILSFADYERISRSAVVFDLRRVELLLERLGNPHLAAKSVHLTGTKGKGSTSAMIASVLTAAGHRTGLYTSPHLLCITERIMVDGKPIPEKDFARLTETMKPEVEAINAAATYGKLTTFELLTALAFLYYREAKADYQVLEVGLGGRLDATNVVPKPQACVITSISYDHMDVLGDTLEKIAAEKSGIIKPGCTVVAAPQTPEAMAVIERFSREKKAKLIKAGSDVTWQRNGFSAEGQTFTVKTRKDSYRLTIPLAGEHQLENAAVAVAALESLIEQGAKITIEHIIKGLAEVNWPGRLQVLRCKPRLVVDGAHNANSAMRLVRALREYFPCKRAFLIFGASHEKDISGMVKELAAFPYRVIVTHANHPRAARTEALADHFASAGVKAETRENVPSAVEFALSQANPDDLIIATGSLFVVAEVMEYLKENSKS